MTLNNNPSKNNNHLQIATIYKNYKKNLIGLYEFVNKIFPVVKKFDKKVENTLNKVLNDLIKLTTKEYKERLDKTNKSYLDLKKELIKKNIKIDPKELKDIKNELISIEKLLNQKTGLRKDYEKILLDNLFVPETVNNFV